MSEEITSGTVPRVPENVVWQELEGKVVALNTVSGRYVSLNATASFLWRSIDGNTTVGQLAQSLAGTYSIDADTALQDTIGLLAELNSGGFLEVR